MAVMVGQNFTHAAQEARTAPPEATPASSARQRQLWLLFWIGVPLFIGLMQGWAGAGSARQLSRLIGLAFVLSGVLSTWWLYGALGLGLRRLAPRLPLPLLLLLSPVIGSLMLRPLYLVRKALFAIPHVEGNYPGLEDPLGLIAISLYGSLMGIISFPLIALFFHRMFRLDVLQWITRLPTMAEARRAMALPTGLLARLPAHLGTDIHALVAAEHYLRVVTARGEAMVLYRLGDAIRDMETASIPGIQTHRSYWIAFAAIAQHSRDGSRLTLTTPTGLAVPVSRSYRQALKARTGL